MMLNVTSWICYWSWRVIFWHNQYSTELDSQDAFCCKWKQMAINNQIKFDSWKSFNFFRIKVHFFINLLLVCWPPIYYISLIFKVFKIYTYITRIKIPLFWSYNSIFSGIIYFYGMQEGTDFPSISYPWNGVTKLIVHNPKSLYIYLN